MRKPSTQYRMADKLANGKLGEILTAGRMGGQSYDDIARRLYADHGIEVTRQTIANWCEMTGEAVA